MTICQAVQSCNNDDWDAYVMSHPASTVYHLSAWRKTAVMNYGAVDRSLVCMEGGRVAGILPLLSIRQFPAGKYLTSGIFGSYDGILADSSRTGVVLADAAVHAARDESAGFIVIKDYTNAEYPGFAPDDEFVTYILGLEGGPESVWKKLQCNTRNHVRKAQKAGVTGALDHGAIRDFLRIYSVNIRDLGTPYPGTGFFTDLASDLGSMIDFILVRLGTKVIGAGMLVRFKDTMYVPFSATLKAYRSYCPGNVLFWHAIECAASRGCRYFDFGRSPASSGTAQFKKQWGASERRLPYRYCVCAGGSRSSFNPNDPKYRLCRSLWKTLPVWLANRLGPGIIKHIL